MSSVPKQTTILDRVAGNWLMFDWCSVCGRWDSDVQFGWWGDPIFCLHCAQCAPPDVQARLKRVWEARRALGFEDFRLHDINQVLWPNSWPLIGVHVRLGNGMPLVFGHPFTDPRSPCGQITEAYCLHGLSVYSPEQLAGDEIAQTALDYAALPAGEEVVEAYGQWWRDQSSDAWGRDHQSEPPPLLSEVQVCIGGAVSSEAFPEARYMWSWRPEAPWLGYREVIETGRLPAKDVDALVKIGRKVLGLHFRGRPPGSGRFESASDFERAVFATVAALRTQKRRVTQDSVGTYLIAKSGRNATTGWHAGDSPADPGRQFREWCKQFERDPKGLLRRAVVTHSGE